MRISWALREGITSVSMQSARWLRWTLCEQNRNSVFDELCTRALRAIPIGTGLRILPKCCFGLEMHPNSRKFSARPLEEPAPSCSLSSPLDRRATTETQRIPDVRATVLSAGWCRRLKCGSQ